VMFTGTADGRVVKLENGEIETIARFGSGPCKTRDDEPTCGRPLGIRAGPNGTLFVVDAYKGLFQVNPQKRAVKLLLSTETPIEGKKMSFVNDLTVTRDGRKIYFTDSSSKWQRRDYLLLVMEGTDDGRLLEYDTVTKEVKVLLDQLRFPNGVQLSPEEDFVLVAETTMARIRRVYVSGLMKGGADMFVENMPGFPDNIRPSSSGGYWVAAATIRANPGFSMLDFLSEKPFIKRMIFKLFSQETVMKFVPRYSLVLELSDSGAFRRSLHDPDGLVVTYPRLRYLFSAQNILEKQDGVAIVTDGVCARKCHCSVWVELVSEIDEMSASLSAQSASLSASLSAKSKCHCQPESGVPEEQILNIDINQDQEYNQEKGTDPTEQSPLLSDLNSPQKCQTSEPGREVLRNPTLPLPRGTSLSGNID
ncbi:hypothetical protein STEG23_012993, partial [Scotinomys teguina]